ncbi:Crp/Fnr family transcriptional regulator [Vibrio porteresiae]|uniref:Crp/Fnr family transcriptional regulator n=1 Tax=Vibrio porteresiae DSM 19223 TaxID=1123496 RepID=A0ABZ0QBM9_9VIBR|nr:Crp/Fnr family transcriptional regulator [Vibrio porteresiae]WPC73810.1 Crp/Fnr family transcriptional regulator [Vibrio porteresiae DSM 19223]
MLEQPFFDYLTQHGFSKSDATSLCDIGKIIELPTRHIIYHQGEHPDSLYWLNSGLCHSSYLTDDRQEITKELIYEQEWIIPCESLVLDEPSDCLVESLTEVSLIELPLDTLLAWRQSQPQLYIRLFELYALQYTQKLRFNCLFSAEERWQLFQQHFSHLCDKVPHELLRRYLS